MNRTTWAKQVKKRDGYVCVKCGSTEKLEAHHIVPVSDINGKRDMYSVENGITLCRACHYEAHGRSRMSW